MTAIDPVCGMEVDEATAQWKADYNGKTYYFCAPGCMRSFQKEPEKYLSGQGGHTMGHGGHSEGHAADQEHGHTPMSGGMHHPASGDDKA